MGRDSLNIKERFEIDLAWIQNGELKVRLRDKEEDRFVALTSDDPFPKPGWTIEKIEKRIAAIVELAKRDPEAAAGDERELIDTVMRYCVNRPKLRNNGASTEALLAAVLKIRDMDFPRY